MLFVAEANGIEYEVIVSENRTHWRVQLKPEGSDPYVHEFPKTDYQKIDNAISFLFKGSSYLVDVVTDGLNQHVYTRGSYRTVKISNDEMLLHESLKGGASASASDHLNAGMPGKIVKIMVSKGDEIKAGDPLLIMEAMKMENEMRAARDGIVADINVSEGETVESGQNLITFES
ncbi:MAG: acetyl-CoA carboxylase biotin carboxyl carrier protein subunit [Bdellovibrionales bacterium]|nr:acetyl-CoA carboxylase biotin carboxyl carrier protein subunit [Bdellovibrionales bacterium]